MLREFQSSSYYDSLSPRERALFDSVVEEVRSLLASVVSSQVTPIQKSSGLLRLGKLEETGELFITGATKRDSEDLREMQNYVAQQLGIKIF